MFKSIYCSLSQEQETKFKQTKLLICDIDGVFSDGRIYLGNDNEEYKAFHTRDGFGIKAIINAGYQVAVITGRKSNIVEKRMSSLGIQHIYQGQEDKTIALQTIMNDCQCNLSEVAYIGDDVPDQAVMEKVGLAIGVADSHPIITQLCHYQTQMKGGFGAVREVCDTLLQVHNKLDSAQGMSV